MGVKIILICNGGQMSLLKKLRSIFSMPGGDSRILWLYIQCDKCGEVIRGRVDLHNDVSVQYGESGGGTSYYCRKVFIGSDRCYQPVEVELYFDGKRNLMQQEISGGKFVDEAAFASA
jgi:hypothetical protein